MEGQGSLLGPVPLVCSILAQCHAVLSWIMLYVSSRRGSTTADLLCLLECATHSLWPEPVIWPKESFPTTPSVCSAHPLRHCSQAFFWKFPTSYLQLKMIPASSLLLGSIGKIPKNYCFFLLRLLRDGKHTLFFFLLLWCYECKAQHAERLQLTLSRCV